MSPETIHELVTLAAGVVGFSILLILPPAVWCAIASKINHTAKKAQARKKKAAERAAYIARQEYVWDMWRQIQ